MKLHYLKILLFVIPLNILARNKNKPYITQRLTPIYASRVLSECGTQSSIYDKDEDIKSVKENFNRQTSQRFEEYEERMQEKRQKRKEQRDKNIQKIIQKNKMEKNLAEKIEKGCLRCGCGLGTVAASVGLFGGLGIYGSETAAWASATVAAKAAGVSEGLKVGLERVTEIAKLSLGDQTGATMPTTTELETLIAGKFNDEVTLFDIFQCISSNIKGQGGAQEYEKFFSAVDIAAQTELTEFNKTYNVPAKAVTDAVTKGEEVAIAAEHAKYAPLYNAIGYSVLAILIIVLIMLIIYLVLRYRRKKKMNKKAQYTKLLKE
ncbi:rifin [Plasmodium reichenowi]|uniref:Rifin n=1 Tax=Plasmodium reichenowi TaxID=5854 RepID=A0A060RMP0_PLARE|nr:rifin [Plasmodium reichenowi]